MLKLSKNNIVDQYSDRSGAELVKIANRMEDNKLSKIAIDMRFNLESTKNHKDLFPVDTPEDTFLSRVYFEGQREKIAADKAAEIDARLSRYEELYNVQSNVKMRNDSHVKQASYAFELLPSCKVASNSDLIQAGKDFCANFSEFNLAECREFASNFMKAAAVINPEYEVPEQIAILGGTNTEVNSDILEHLNLRKLAAERSGKDGKCYEKLAQRLMHVNPVTVTREDMWKIAEAIDFADKQYDMRNLRTGSTLPPAWRCVFSIKQAEDQSPKHKEETLTKAQIICRYGEGVLEEVEKENGEIDQEKLKAVISELPTK